jgi:aspartate racemase
VKTIGILGGMGPRSTIMFEQMLVERCVGSDQQIPTIVTINDGSVPDRSQYLLGFGTDPVPSLQQNLNMLRLMGAEVIAIPCNSACMTPIFVRLTSPAHLLNLPLLVVENVQKIAAKKVCLLATEGTVQSGTYQELCSVADIECIVPTKDLQNVITEIIANVKIGNVVAAKIEARLAALLIKRLECEAVILGCTELPLIERQLLPAGMIGINSLAILADACVKYSKRRTLCKPISIH